MKVEETRVLNVRKDLHVAELSSVGGVRGLDKDVWRKFRYVFYAMSYTCI